MDTRLDKKQTIERWGIRFTGIVQGVGFSTPCFYVGPSIRD